MTSPTRTLTLLWRGHTLHAAKALAGPATAADEAIAIVLIYLTAFAAIAALVP